MQKYYGKWSQKNFKDHKKKFSKIKNLDDYKVFLNAHNPVTIEKEVLNKIGLQLNGIYFYHYHAIPPIFENIDKINFRKQPYKMEKPSDWRGFFIASGFVIDCQKI